MNPDEFQVLSVKRSPEAELFAADLLNELRAELGCVVCPKPSTIPGAGQGAICEGRAAAGRVVGLYPGIVYLPGHLLRSEGALEALYPGTERERERERERKRDRERKNERAEPSVKFVFRIVIIVLPLLPFLCASFIVRRRVALVCPLRWGCH